MPSFQLSVSPHRRAAAKFIAQVRRSIQEAYSKQPALTQTAIAKELDVHRSVVNRQLRGHQDMTLGRVAELAHILGYEPEFHLVKVTPELGANEAHAVASPNPFSTVVSSSTAAETTRKNRQELELS